MSGSKTATARWAPWLAMAVVASVLAVPVLPLPAALRGDQRADAAGTSPIISTFYVPLFEDNAYNALESVNSATNPALSSTTSITVAASGTVLYYDHWEDGYETTPDTPSQGTTLVLGDGNAANGDAASYCVPARCAGDVFPTGAVVRMNNSSTITPGSLVVPRSAATVVFDGRDKISSTGGLAVAHATWPTNTNALHSEMSAAFDTSRWGVNFVAPVGTNTPRQKADGQDHFSYSSIEVMAKDANTSVSIDANADGDYLDANDVNGTVIGEGQTVFVNGNVRQGARVVTTKPVQAFMMTGRIGSNYEDRSFQLFPTEGLVNDYIAPASTASAADAQATVLYIFNPQASAITVTVTTSSGSTNYTVPAGQVLDPAPFLGVGQAARITSATTFAAIGATGTRMGATGQDYDWGYALVPARLLSTSINAGWAPGSQDLSNATYNPVWVTTTDATTLYADYDGDPTTGANLDPNGGRYDQSYTVTAALGITKITDPNDNDMTGAHVYTTDNVTFAAAYGEDPSTAPTGFPGIDLGTALFPSCGALCVQKTLSIVTDVDSDGQVDPGDTVQWTILGRNTGYNDLTNAVLKDELPAGVTYVPGSTTVNGNAVADDVVPPAATSFPYDESGSTLGTVAVGGTVTVRFQVTVNNPYDGPSTNKISNSATMLSDQAAGGDSSEVALDTLRITKTSNGQVPVTVGQNLSYTITVSNSGSSTLTTIPVNDVLPRGLTWGSTTVTRPVDATYTIADDFQTTDWTGSTGTVAWSQSAWQESNDSATAPIASTGQIRNFLETTSQRARFIGVTTTQPALSRVAGDLSAYTRGATLQFDYKRSSLEAGDAVVAEIRPNGAASWTTLGTYVNGSDANYVAASFDVSAHVGTATAVRFRVSDDFDQTNDIFYVDNVRLTLTKREPATTSGTSGPTVYTLSELMAGESATIVVSTTVASVPDAEIFNTATATSGSFISKSTVNDCAICFDFGDLPASYDTGDPARARVATRVSYASSTVADNFQTTGSWAGSSGTVAWSQSAWQEVDASGTGTGAGNLRKETDLGDLSASYRANSQLGNQLSRIAGDLTSYTAGVVLTMERRCNGLEADDVVTLEIRKDSSSGWQALKTWSSCTDAAYQAESFVLDQSAQVGTATEIRVRVSQAFESGDAFWFDNLQLALSAPTYTLTGPILGVNVDRELTAASAAPGGPPTGDDTAGSPADEDGVTLPSVDTNRMTIPFTVADPSGGTTFVNAWFDWDDDGSFSASESIFSASSFVSGTNGLAVSNSVGSVPGPGSYSVTVNVPDLSTNGSGLQIGDSVYARFRVATNGSDIAAAKATGVSTDGEVEDYRTTLNTLPVTLSYIRSHRTGRQVVLDWRTAQEVDNAGFDIYAGPARSRVKLTASPVPSASPTSAVSQDYTLTVRTKARQLWIEDIALDGTREMHGPFAVGRTYGDPAAIADIDWQSARRAVDAASAPIEAERIAAARRASAQRRTRGVTDVTVEKVASLTVDTAGIQTVSFADLTAAGVDLTGVPASALALVDPSGPVPLAVEGPSTIGPGTTLSFVGQLLDTLYSSVNVYQLWIDPSRAERIGRQATLPPPTAAPATTYRTTTVVEPEQMYSVTAPGDDPWFDTTLLVLPGFSSVKTATATRTVTADAPVLNATATAAVTLFGMTADSAPQQHIVSLDVNGVPVASARFDDLQEHRLSATLPPGVLRAGDNTMTVTFSTADGVLVDLIAVDTWELSYTRSTVASGGRIDMTSSGRSIGVTGMPAGETVVYRVTNRHHVTALASRTTRGTLTFEGTQTPQRYLVASRSSLARPAVAPARPTVDLLDGSADYLILADAVFDDALAPLADFHTASGLSVRVVDVADVYEQYSGGVLDAAAVDAYLADAVPALGARFVLLVGADTIDYRDYDGDGSFSLMPSLYGATGYNVRFAPLDPAYADIDGDGVADVALGRMPAHTPDELSVMIGKTLAYAAHPAPRTAVLASDANDGFDYAAANDMVEDALAGWSVQRADLDRIGVDDARTVLTDAIAGGVGLTLYLGHSGTHEWTEQGLFDAATAGDLTNDVPTVVAQFGCWNTYYVTTEGDSLGQVLMSDPQGGAAAVLGSTTLTSARSDMLLAGLLATNVARGHVTLGEALLAAKMELAAIDGRTTDVQLGWTMMGDPALVVGGSE